MGTTNTLILDQAESLTDNTSPYPASLSDEANLLTRLMRSDEMIGGALENALEIDKLLADPALRWDEVIRLGRRHGGMPLFYKTLKDRPHALVPANIKTRLQNDFHRIGMHISMQIEMLRKVNSSFNAAGIPLLFFKGIQLGAQAYGNPIWRKPGDLDILIHAHQIDDARAVLTNLGFDTRMSPVQEEEQIARQQQLTFYGKTTDVDVHFSLQQRSFLKMSYAATFDSENVWKRATHFDFDGISIPCLSAEDQFCLLCVHSAKHGWYRLYMMADIAAFMANVKLNWHKVSIRAKRIKAERMLSLSVLLANKLFETPIPKPIASLIEKDASLPALSEQILFRLFDDDAEEKSFQFHRIQTGLFPKWSQKALYLSYVTAQHLKRKRSE
ncbi:MAG: nucleotidyltransferase family protein [Rhodothermales bacterium]